MFAKTIWISAFSAFALLGCVYPNGAMPYHQADTHAQTSRYGPGCHAGGRICVVAITKDDDQTCGFSFTPDKLSVDKGVADFVMVLRLPPGYEFREGDGDGAKFNPAPSGKEFDGFNATDDDDGAVSSAGRGRRYRWINKNSYAQDYKYSIQFHRERRARQYNCDPIISNLGR